MRGTRADHRGFTLIEVLVVIASLAWLVAPPILVRRQNAKTQEAIRQSPDYQRWREHEDQAEQYYNNQTPRR